MDLRLAASLASVTVALAFAIRMLLGGSRAASIHAARPSGAEREPDRCSLCNGRLPSSCLTRDELIARLETRIRSDTTSITGLLSRSPPSDWMDLFRPSSERT